MGPEFGHGVRLGFSVLGFGIGYALVYLYGCRRHHRKPNKWRGYREAVDHAQSDGNLLKRKSKANTCLLARPKKKRKSRSTDRLCLPSLEVKGIHQDLFGGSDERLCWQNTWAADLSAQAKIVTELKLGRFVFVTWLWNMCHEILNKNKGKHYL